MNTQAEQVAGIVGDATARDDILDVLAQLGSASQPGPLEDLVEPLLRVLGELSGLESVYLTSIDWDEEVQRVELARNVAEGFEVPAGAEVAWHDTLCELSLAEGSGWNTDVPGTWTERNERLGMGIQSYVSVPVRTDTDEPPVGTLCGASPRQVEPDPRLVEVLHLFAGMIATALQRDAAVARAEARADDAERRLADRIRFAAQVEHAMKSPLTVITGWVTTIRRRDDRAVLEQGLDTIQRTTERLTDQVRELLVEARAAIGAGTVEDVDVRALAQDCHELAAEGQLTVEGRLRLRTDPVAVHVLLEHLVENAVTHTPPGTPIRVVLRDRAIVVEDDGPGLPTREDLFEPFVTANPDVRGTGLGLHIIQSITERLGGEITAGASDSGGARFTVTFG